MKENIYGHLKRLLWIVDHIDKQQVIVELGCGTGYMISLPLTKMGYSVYGFDLDKDSIVFGQEIFRREGLDPKRLIAGDIGKLSITPDVIIASEVLEHLHDAELTKALRTVLQKLKVGGLLLVTVPNGYGWFEMESFVWFKTGIGRLLQRLKIAGLINKFKCLFLGREIEAFYPSTLSNSHHQQHFTFNSIRKLLISNGFEVKTITGSVLFAGPFSNLFFTGINPVMKINCILGHWFPRFASGFYIGCRASCKGSASEERR
jgi:2-polyprenyl-3-methyl-5-hydroxy-6-metoxy-1,4-benzoquinol methylase